ncbi:MAG TPA: hypothetical protein VF665_06255 [Longimicrobium sp.]|jgi:hypothetical protein|uniref:hypothetical protein n=1 Tax=Longimicrobium sp. TaxID=2029185 RepID=UPI002EDADC6D
MREAWDEGETPEERVARQDAYRRLAEAARRVGLSVESLADMMRQVAHNEVETRRFLSEQVYGVPDAELDTFLRTRMDGEGGAK